MAQYRQFFRASVLVCVIWAQHQGFFYEVSFLCAGFRAGLITTTWSRFDFARGLVREAD
jgi:hypothetical protein